MIINHLKSPQPLGEAITETMRKLKLQNVKLDQVIFRLRQRDCSLLEACAAAMKKKSMERATICANEVTEVRKLLKIVAQSQLAIERIVLRLETLKDLNDVIIDLKPALSLLKETAEGLGRIVPDVASELEKVNDSVTETLAMTQMGSPQPITPFEAKTLAGEEVLKEVSAFLEERLSEELPQPPVPVIMKETIKPKVRQMVALTAGCPEIEVQTEGEPEKQAAYRDLQGVSFTINQASPPEETSPLEDIVLDYAKRYKGEVDVTRCADELNVPPEEVTKALKSLGAKGVIQIQRWQT